MIPEPYKADETPGVGWAVFDPWGELLAIFTTGEDPGQDARDYAACLNNPNFRPNPRLAVVR